MTRKTNPWKYFITFIAGAAFSPSPWIAKPISSEINRTWRMFPSVNAEKKVVGMMLRRKSSVPLAAPFTTYWADAMLMPAPGWIKFPTTSPTARARVDITRK